MQYSIATAISTIILASTLTSAAAVPKLPTTINIQIKTGSGDASTQDQIAVGSLQTTQSTKLPLGSGVNAQVVDSGFTCQVFSDAKGAKKLGPTFTDDNQNPASFTDASDGEVDSDISAAVLLGSICCAPTAQFQALCGKLGSGSGASASSGINNSGSGKAAGSDAFSVRIQIDGLSELATQGEILADGKRHALTAPLIGEGATSVQINEAPKGTSVQCDAFDKAGKKLGAFAIGKDASFSPNGVTIETIACKSVA